MNKNNLNQNNLPTNQPAPIIQQRFTDADLATAQAIAKKLGYGENTQYTSGSDLTGLFCLASPTGPWPGCIIKTAQFGFMFVQDLGDLGLKDEFDQEPEADAPEPWPKAEADQLAAMARRCFQHSYAHSRPDPDNCEGCCLTMGRDKSGPNSSGWERLYVQSRRTIPKKWRKAFLAKVGEVGGDNAPYVAALRRDVATFGKPSFSFV